MQCLQKLTQLILKKNLFQPVFHSMKWSGTVVHEVVAVGQNSENKNGWL